jgi:hypothetical protein
MLSPHNWFRQYNPTRICLIVGAYIVGLRGRLHIRICVRFGVRFRGQFAGKPDRDPILYLTPITMVCLHISAYTKKIPCWIPLAGIVHRIVRKIARVDGP